MGKRKVATEITRGLDGSITVRYHSTDVVKVDKDRNITLDHGGWMTPTTKSRMNEAAVDFNLAFSVSRERRLVHSPPRRKIDNRF